MCTYIYIYPCSILWPATGYPPATFSHPHHLYPLGAGGENRKRKSEKKFLVQDKDSVKICFIIMMRWCLKLYCIKMGNN